MRFVIVNHDTKEIEICYSAEDMVNRIVEITSTTKCKPTHLAVDKTGITIILSYEQ